MLTLTKNFDDLKKLGELASLKREVKIDNYETNWVKETLMRI